MHKPLLLLLLLWIAPFSSLLAQTDTAGGKRQLVVGVKSTPPFIIKTNDGYTGVSVDLWKEVANRLNLTFECREYDLVNLLKAVESGEVDVCINPLTVTSARVERMAFTQPFYISNLSIAVPKKDAGYLWLFIRNFFTLPFLKAVLLLLGVIFVFGLILWLVEHRSNPDQFGSGIRGIGAGIWWSAVTMTTVGYGDKAPETFAGRVVATIWMFTAIIIISGFTASIASALTVNQLDTNIKSLQDLRNVNVGVVKGSSSAQFLRSRNILFHETSDALAGLQALAAGEVEAFLYDEPIMRYLLANHDFGNEIQILPYSFDIQYYSFALPKNSPLVQPLNPVLLELIESPQWKQILSAYNLGGE